MRPKQEPDQTLSSRYPDHKAQSSHRDMMGSFSRKEKQHRTQKIAVHQGEEKDLFAKAARNSTGESE
jgi:hypothetical protein